MYLVELHYQKQRLDMNACYKIPQCFSLTTGTAYRKVKKQVSQKAKCENTNK